MTKEELINATKNNVEIWKRVLIVISANSNFTFRDVHTIDGYVEVSNLGNLRKKKSNGKYKYYSNDVRNKKKYIRNKLKVKWDTRKYMEYARHQLVLQTFFPDEIPDLMLIDHKNQDGSDNRLINLKWSDLQSNEANNTYNENVESIYDENKRLKELLLLHGIDF